MILATNPTPKSGQATESFQFEWAWLEVLRDEPAWLFAALAGILLVVALMSRMYWRERHAKSAPLILGLAALRLVAIAGVVAMLLGPQRRRAEQVTRPSRVVVLVDSSVSMAMANKLSDGSTASISRTEAAGQLLDAGGILEQLSSKHTVGLAATSAVGKVVDLKVSETGEIQIPGNLAEFLQPSGSETRLGDALRNALEEFAGEPLAGLVLLSDGRNNAGEDPPRSAADAKLRGTRVLTIGFGPDRAGANLVVREIVAPRKAYPNDEIEITAVLELTGSISGSASLSLFRKPEGGDEGSEVLLATRALALDTEESAPSARFKTRPGQPGRFRYIVRASPLPREVRRDDNQRDAAVEVIDRVTKVLLWAGGPNRDYRFLRNQLRRDDSFEVDVLLETASEAALQDARTVLQHFPETEEELDEYDVLVAYDPDWSTLGDQQVDLLEDWVSRRGGGVLFAPARVNTPKWLQRSPSPKLKSMLPIVLSERLALLSPLQSGPAPQRPSPVQLTRVGLDADFLWVAGGREASRAAWSEFDGFFRIGEIESLRPGATVFAEAVSPTTGDSSVLFAEQFYGAGRVFYCGSNELWRMRSDDPSFFTVLHTKLLRRLAQGRLLADSPEGSLLFERDRYDVGDTMVLRALLPGGRGEESYSAQILSPSGDITSLELMPSESQIDSWSGRLLAKQDGIYEAQLTRGDAPELSARTEVTTPAAEREKTTRDEQQLIQIAQAGGGWYYPTPEAALNGSGPAPAVADALPSREETRTLYGKPDRRFAESVSQLLLAVICGALCLEWFVRRLSRMA